MNARATRRGIPAVVIWGGCCALAWAAFTILTGGGSAQADEQAGGPLDGLTSVVSETASAVTTPVVTQVVAPVVTQVAAPVVQAVVAPVQQVAPAVAPAVTQAVSAVPVAGPAVAPVVQAVAHTAQAAVAPITDALTDGSVSQITAPILDAVTGLPIVGGVIDDLGTRDLVDQVVGVVDHATEIIGGTTEETVTPILGGLNPATLGASVLGSAEPSSLAASKAHRVASWFASTHASGVSDSGSFLPIAAEPGLPSIGATVVLLEHETPASAPPAPPGSPITPTSSGGSGGGSGSALARVSDASAPSLCAWERASGASDDALPASPVADTDVSPD